MGKPVLTRVDGGWFLGTVVGAAVNAKGKKDVPGATHTVKYVRRATDTVGKVPTDMVGTKPFPLVTKHYGMGERWLLLLPA